MKYLHVMPDNFYTKTFIEVVNSHFPRDQHSFFLLYPTKKEAQEAKFTKHTFLNVKRFYMPEQRFSKLKQLIFRRLHTGILPDLVKFDKILIHFLSDEAIKIFHGYVKREGQSISWIVWGADLFNHVNIQMFDPETLRYTHNKRERKPFITFFRVIVQGLDSIFFKRVFNGYRKKVIAQCDHIIGSDTRGVRIVKRFFKTTAVNHDYFHYPNPVDFQQSSDGLIQYDSRWEFKKKFQRLVLLGNSGKPTNNHLDAFLLLAKHPCKDFGIVCPLSYGYKDYIKWVIEKGRSFFGERFIPLLDFLDPKVYGTILNQIDVAMMFHNRQQGFGNTRLLLSLGKKVYMKKTNIFYKLKKLGILVFPVDDLKDDIENSRDFFILPPALEKNKDLTIEVFGRERVIKMMKKLFDSI